MLEYHKTGLHGMLCFPWVKFVGIVSPVGHLFSHIDIDCGDDCDDGEEPGNVDGFKAAFIACAAALMNKFWISVIQHQANQFCKYWGSNDS